MRKSIGPSTDQYKCVLTTHFQGTPASRIVTGKTGFERNEFCKLSLPLKFGINKVCWKKRILWKKKKLLETKI